MNSKDYSFWFVIGSQHLYGPEVIKKVADHGKIMTAGFNEDDLIPWRIDFKGVVTTPDEISQVLSQANTDQSCAGVMTWMHTFSPSKMWIAGLDGLQKPYLHLNTQFNREIPFETIDMDFMNMNQAAHGDREHGFISARLRKRRKIIAGFWQDAEVRNRIGGWMRSAIGTIVSRKLKVARFGDNMREVAVTEGDKVEAQRVLGWSVNTFSVGGLADAVSGVTQPQIESKLAEYRSKYVLNTQDVEAVKYQAKLEIALENWLVNGGFDAYTDTFEDLYHLEQLPGLASQNLMSKGYGFGAEGDWKLAALTHVIKAMSQGLAGGASFMEDYTYHLEKGNELVLGAHMLEICPSIALDKPRIEVHPLGIGGKKPPARLVFDGRAGDAILVTLTDMGDRFRMIVHDIQAVTPIQEMPQLPVARVMWKPMPDLYTGSECWIYAGGAHHSVLSYALTAEHMRDFAEILGVEFVHIHAGTNINDLKKEVEVNDLIWKFKR